MKKIIITSVLLLVCVLGFSQSNNSKLKIESEKIFNRVTKNNIWVQDTMFGYTWGILNSDWEWVFDYTIIVQNRNEMGQPIETISTFKETIQSVIWDNFYQSFYSYYDNDSVNEFKVYEWKTSTNNWNTDPSVYSKYNENGVLQEHIYKSWDVEEQIFTAGNKEIYTYHDNGLLFTKEDRDWDYINETWLDWGTTTHYYDENNNDTLIEQILFNGNKNIERKTYNAQNQLTFSQEWIYLDYSGELIDDSKTTYSYYDNGLVEEEFIELYDYDNSQEWYNLSRSTYIYNDNNLIDSLIYDDLDVTDNSERTKYTYNSHLDETGFKIYEVNDGGWRKYYEVFYTYDGNYNQTSYHCEGRDVEGGGVWRNIFKEDYYWHTFQTSSIPTNNYGLVIAPNPVSDILNIQTSDNVFVQIFNSAGVLQFSTTETNIDVSSLKKGIYLVLIKNKNYNLTRKIIIE